MWSKYRDTNETFVRQDCDTTSTIRSGQSEFSWRCPCIGTSARQNPVYPLALHSEETMFFCIIDILLETSFSRCFLYTSQTLEARLLAELERNLRKLSRKLLHNRFEPSCCPRQGTRRGIVDNGGG